MTKQEIVEKVKALNLPTGSYVVFGSCPLAAAGLREAHDVDMLVSDDVIRELERRGWQQVDKGKDDKPLTYDVFEAHNSWSFSTYNPTLHQLLDNADVFEGIPFASLADVRKWKVASGRPKDFKDIELIDNFLASK